MTIALVTLGVIAVIGCFAIALYKARPGDPFEDVHDQYRITAADIINRKEKS